MKIILFAGLIGLAPGTLAAPLPGDATDGKRLHDANCTACHDTAVYTRKNHSVQSLNALKQRFEACSHMANKEFTPSEAQNVFKYLNDEFYQFQ